MLKWKIIHAMLKVNMDNYRCYLTARVRIFKSSGQDLAGEKFFTLRVHHPISTMETQMAAHLVTVSLMMMLPSSDKPVLVLSFDFWLAGSELSFLEIRESITLPHSAWSVSCSYRQGRDQMHGLYWWKNTNKTKTSFILL